MLGNKISVMIRGDFLFISIIFCLTACIQADRVKRSPTYWSHEGKSVEVREHQTATLQCGDARIYVTRAWYYYENRGQDFVSRVRKICAHSSTCSVLAENNYLGNDPSVGDLKFFKVEYNCEKDCPIPQHCSTVTCTTAQNVKCLTCKFKLLHKVKNGRCIDTCSWKNRLCWPGTCADDFAQNCVCDNNFRRTHTTLETSCQPIKQPTLLTCRMRVTGPNGEIAFSKSIGRTTCSNKMDFYGNFQLTSIFSHLQSEYSLNTTSLKPDFVGGYTFGILDSSFTLINNDLEANTNRNVEIRTLKKDGKPILLFDGNATMNYKDNLTNGDSVCVKFETKGGGHVLAKDISTSAHTISAIQYTKTTSSKTLCYIYDNEAPVHCGDTKSCTSHSMSLSRRIIDIHEVEVSTSGWLDPVPERGTIKHTSGISTMTISVNEMKAFGDELGVGSFIRSYSITDSIEVSLPTANTPMMYQILLEVKDEANNLRKTRRFVLHDNTSSISIVQNHPLYPCSASQETAFRWQTTLTDMCFCWKDRYLNKEHVDGKILHRIRSVYDIEPLYDQIMGELPIYGTLNVHGITNYKFELYRNQSKTNLHGSVPNFTQEKVCLTHDMKDGDYFTFKLVASDIVNHTYAEETSVLIDSTVPEISDIYLVKDGVKRLFVHSSKDLSTMKLQFNVFDIHSGIHTILWSFRASDDHIKLGAGSLGVGHITANETCPANAPCYCSSVGSCEFSNYTINLNPLVKNNTHIGNHNRRYMFSLRVTNKAMLSVIEHLDILVDVSPPEVGVVNEGPPGAPDIDYISVDSFIAHWHGFIDHESGIKLYKVAVGPQCLTREELLSCNISEEIFITHTSGNSLRLPISNGSKSFVSVIALNNAMDASEAVCSDGIYFDDSVPLLENITIHRAKITEGVGCLGGEPWMINENLQRIKLELSPKCLNVCQGNYDNEFLKHLPIVIKDDDNSKSDFFCYHLPLLHNNVLIYLPNDAIHMYWNISNDSSQIGCVEIGFGSDASLTTSPDIESYRDIGKFNEYSKHHTGFSDGQIFYIFIKVQNKASVFDIVTIGPIVIDETPPICPLTIPVTIREAEVLIPWTNATYKEIEQKEQINSIFIRIHSDKGHSTPFLEWRLEDNAQTCGAIGVECMSYPLQVLQNLDSEAGLDFAFELHVYNKAGHFCSFSSEKFKVPSKYNPGKAQVIDIDPNSVSENFDTDASFNQTAYCVRYLGLRHHEHIKIEYGLGTQEETDDVIPFEYKDVEEGSTFCKTNIDLKLNIRYFVTLKASCSGGTSYSSSDGFYVLNSSHLQSSMSVKDGPKCSENTLYDTTIGHSDQILFSKSLHIGRPYTINVNALSLLWIPNVTFTSTDVTILETKSNSISFIAQSNHPQFELISGANNLTFELYGCIDDIDFSTSRNEVYIHWTVHSFYSSMISHYVYGIQKRRSQKYITIIERKTKHTFVLVNHDFEKGLYRDYVMACFGQICGPKVYSDGFKIVQAKPTVGLLHSEVTLFQNGSSVLFATWDPLVCEEKDDDIILYQYGMYKDDKGSVPYHGPKILENDNLTETKVTEHFRESVKPYQDIYFCLKGFCRSTLSKQVCSKIVIESKFNFLDTFYVFDINKYRTNQNLIYSTEGIVNKLTILDQSDVDFATSNTVLQGMLLPTQDDVVTWFLMTERRMPTGVCHTDVACKISKQTRESSVHFNTNYLNGVVYFICASVNVPTNESYPQGVCSDGFKIDNEEPLAGTVIIGSNNDFQSDGSELFVYWEGFQDEEQGSFNDFKRNRISKYELAIGTYPKGQDVISFTDTGLATTYAFSNISLVSGLLYFATVRAYDMANHTVEAVSDGVIVDQTPPSRGMITVGHFRRHKYYVGGEIFVIHWMGFYDEESGIDRFELAIGTTPYAEDVYRYHEVNGTSLEIHLSTIYKGGHKFYATLMVTNRAGLSTYVCSEEFIIDASPPQGGVVRDGLRYLNHDIDYQINTTSIAIHWTGFTDPESSISFYRAGLGITPMTDDVFALHNVDLQSSWTWHAKFSEGMKYFALVEACNAAGMCTLRSSNGIILDASPPITGIARVSKQGHHSKYIPTSSSVHAEWIGFQDPQSNIRNFQVCLGTTKLCDIVPWRNVLLSDKIIINELLLPVGEPLYLTVKAFNHVGLSSIATSDMFIVDNTPPVLQEAPVFTNCISDNEIQYQFDPSFLCIRWNFTDDGSPITSQTIQYYTHDGGHVPVQHSYLGSIQNSRLILDAEEWLLSGDTYSATVSVCNAAGLCTSAGSGRLLIDSTAPHVGGFKPPLKWDCNASSCTINVTWYGFKDVESGIKTYYLTVGASYSGYEYSGKIVEIPAEPLAKEQSTVLLLKRNVRHGDKIILGIWAVNNVGLKSSHVKTTAEAQEISPKGNHGNLFIEKHSCVIHYCNNECTCAVFGQKCDPSQTVDCKNSSNGAIDIIFEHSFPYNALILTSSGSCFVAKWNKTKNVLRYEWSIGLQGYSVGDGVFDKLVEPIWYDNGLLTNVTHCVSRQNPLKHAAAYIFYVRVWTSANEFFYHSSKPILIDRTPPSIRKGQSIKDSNINCISDMEFSRDPHSLTACWKGVFSDQQSGIQNYEVSVGTMQDGDDVVAMHDVGINRNKTWTNLSLYPGTKYYITVRANNHVGLSSLAFSDGFVVDFENPNSGTVFNSKYYRNHHVQNQKESVSASWYGFQDKHSFIKFYFVAVVSCDNEQPDLNFITFTNVGLNIAHTFRNMYLKHNHMYCMLVKAEDAAGLQSNISISKGVLIDGTPPSVYQSSHNGSIINFTATTIVPSENGVMIKGSSLLIINEFYDIKFSVLNQTSDASVEFDIEGFRISVLLPSDDSGTAVGDFKFISPCNGMTDMAFMFSNVAYDNHTRINIVNYKSDLQHNPTQGIEVEQMSPEMIGVLILMVDAESGISNISVAIGTSKGGNQIRPMSAAGLTRHLFYQIDIPHRAEVFVTAMVENNVGLQTYAYSDGLMIDHTGPVFSSGQISLEYLKKTKLNGTATKAMVYWNVQDQESSVRSCKIALGSVRGADDIVHWTMTDNISYYESEYIPIPHGERVHAMVKCTNRIRLSTSHYIHGVVVSYAKPTVDNVYAEYIGPLGPFLDLPVDSDLTNMTLYWDGFDDQSGILGYQCRLRSDHSGISNWTRPRNRTFMSLQSVQVREGYVLTTEIKAQNKGRIDSKVFNTSIASKFKKPKLTGKPIVLHSDSKMFNLNWDGVFNNDISYEFTVSVGSSEGQSDILRYMQTTHLSVALDIETTKEIFVVVTARDVSGLQTTLRQTLRVI